MIATGKVPSHAAALAALKKQAKSPGKTIPRQVKYLNTILKADHGKLKLLIRRVSGFKTLKTARATTS
jgi:transposase-like protein